MSEKETEVELEITKLVTAMAALFPSVQVGNKTIKGFVAMLRDIPLDILRTAIDQVSSESKFFPTVAEIRERVIALQMPDIPNGITAWGEVMEAFQRYGFYRLPKFDNPITAEAVVCMGWKELCSSENAEADRAHFSRIYDDLARRQKENARLLPASRQLKESARLELGDGR